MSNTDELLAGAFINYDRCSMCNIDSTLVTFDNHNVSNNLFVVDISSDIIEIPIFAKAIIENIIRNKLESKNDFDKVIISMYTNSQEQHRNTAISIVKNSFSGTHFNDRLTKFKTKKGEVYYGGRGILLDKEFNILLLYTLTCKKEIQSNNTIMVYYKGTIHIGAQTFLRKKDIICNCIINKIIPFYISNSSYAPSITPKFKNTINSKPEIVIDYVNKFMESPIKPSPNKCTNDTLNELLIDNIDEIIEQL